MKKTSSTIISRETRLKGLSISSGIAFSRTCLFHEGRHSDMPDYRVTKTEIPKQIKRFEKARKAASKKFENLIREVRNRIGPAEAEIFVAQKMILEDPSLEKRIHAIIERDRVNAEKALSKALDDFEAKLQLMDHDYLKERASDIGEIKRRLLDVMADISPSLECAGQKHCRKGKNRIVVARELTPSLTTELDTRHTRGFVTEHGGAGSHAAILARSLGIPAVSGIRGIHDAISCGTEILIDGDRGRVIVWPSAKTLEKYPQLKHHKPPALPGSIGPVKGLVVMANLNLSRNVDETILYRAEGIGLYRTEFEFLSEGRFLDEDEQYKRYVKVLKAMRGRPVYFRLLDIGGDKRAPFLKLPREENPYLGFRGGRYLLKNPCIFHAQCRALARASRVAPVHVMYPMVIDSVQFRKLKTGFQKAVRDLPGLRIRHGVMFEVPSACLEARKLLEMSDFASIGANDLIQYLFAVDRNNERVASDYHPNRRVFWDLVSRIAEEARKQDRSLSICGEIAGQPRYLKKLISSGIERVSVSPKMIPALRNSISGSQSPLKKKEKKR